MGQRKKTVPSAWTGHTDDRADNIQQPLSSHLTCEKVNSDTQVCSQQVLWLSMHCKSLPFVSDMATGSDNRNLFLSSFMHPGSSVAGRGLLTYCHNSLCYCHWDHQNVRLRKSNPSHWFLLWISQVTPHRSVLVDNCPNKADFSPVDEVMTCPIVLAWQAHTFINVHLAVDPLVSWYAGTGVEPNMIIAQSPILAWVWITFIYFSIAVHTFVTKQRNTCITNPKKYICAAWTSELQSQKPCYQPKLTIA